MRGLLAGLVLVFCFLTLFWFPFGLGALLTFGVLVDYCENHDGPYKPESDFPSLYGK